MREIIFFIFTALVSKQAGAVGLRLREPTPFAALPNQTPSQPPLPPQGERTQAGIPDPEYVYIRVPLPPLQYEVEIVHETQSVPNPPAPQYEFEIVPQTVPKPSAPSNEMVYVQEQLRPKPIHYGYHPAQEVSSVSPCQPAAAPVNPTPLKNWERSHASPPKNWAHVHASPPKNWEHVHVTPPKNWVYVDASSSIPRSAPTARTAVPQATARVSAPCSAPATLRPTSEIIYLPAPAPPSKHIRYVPAPNPVPVPAKAPIHYAPVPSPTAPGMVYIQEPFLPPPQYVQYAPAPEPATHSLTPCSAAPSAEQALYQPTYEIATEPHQHPVHLSPPEKFEHIQYAVPPPPCSCKVL